MVAEQQPKTQPDSHASVQIHITPIALEAQEGTGELEGATTAADIPWWARLHIEAYAGPRADAQSEETPNQ